MRPWLQCSNSVELKRLPAILTGRCPKCRDGRIFSEPIAYRLKTLNDMPDNCPVCSEKFMPEPGFYFGAAYVSYGLTVALWVAIWVAMHTFGALGWIEFEGFLIHPELFLGVGVASLIVTLPPLWRLSRIIWIHMFVNYDLDKRDKPGKTKISENRKGPRV
jgi:hypothetical protein